MGVPNDVRQFFNNFDAHNINKVITPYGLTRGFHASAAALPQGDEASPMLWNAIMDMMLQHTKRDTGQYSFVTGWQTKAAVSQAGNIAARGANTPGLDNGQAQTIQAWWWPSEAPLSQGHR